MVQESTFDLQNFNQALYNVHQLLASPDIKSSGTTELNAWWNRRSAKLNTQLMQRLPQATTARQRLFLRMASFLLQPQQPGIETKLATDVADYAVEIGERVTKEFENISGAVRLRRTGRTLDVVAEQIEDLSSIVREVRSVIYAWQDAEVWFDIKGSEVSSKVSHLQMQYLRHNADDLSLGISSESVVGMLSKLTPLKEVVAYVDASLATAYREDLGELWEDFDQKLRGYRDSSERIVWVTPDLRTHVSYNWINSAQAALKSTRVQLNQKMEDIVRHLKYQHLEAVELTGVGQSQDPASDEQLVRTFIVSQRQSGAVIREKSVLEQADEDITYIQEHATLDDYKEYTNGVAQVLLDKLTNRLLAAGVLQRGQSLTTHLDNQIKTIQDLRKGLLPVIGGELLTGESANGMTVYGLLYASTAQYIRSAAFDKARGICTQEETRLTEAIQSLEICKAQSNPSLPGMAQRLIGAAEKEINRLKEEKEYVSKVKECVDTLERDYLRWQEKFESNLSEWNKQKHGGFRIRFRRTNESDYYQVAVDAFCECRKLCPEDEWVRAWMHSQGNVLEQCRILDREQWLQQYFAGLPKPIKAGLP